VDAVLAQKIGLTVIRSPLAGFLKSDVSNKIAG
jgi:hypothetical protein